MWIAIIVLSNLLTFVVSGLVVHRITENECQVKNSVTSLKNIPATTQPDIETQK